MVKFWDKAEVDLFAGAAAAAGEGAAFAGAGVGLAEPNEPKEGFELEPEFVEVAFDDELVDDEDDLPEENPPEKLDPPPLGKPSTGMTSRAARKAAFRSFIGLQLILQIILRMNTTMQMQLCKKTNSSGKSKSPATFDDNRWSDGNSTIWESSNTGLSSFRLGNSLFDLSIVERGDEISDDLDIFGFIRQGKGANLRTFSDASQESQHITRFSGISKPGPFFSAQAYEPVLISCQDHPPNADSLKENPTYCQNARLRLK